MPDMRDVRFNRTAFALAGLVMAAALAACGSGGGDRTPSATHGAGTPASSATLPGTRTPGAGPTATGGAPTPAGATPSATVEPGLQIVAAPIDKLDLITRESSPPQYAVRITSGLPDGCTKFHEARIAGRSGTTITIAVTNTHPSDPMIACTAIYGEHEAVIELGSDFAPGAQYTVRVNDQELRFTAQ
jgi:hypothetical protein